ncbi:MAG: protein kinase [Planctomycetes bacterium]|nr:protein kinase [Planctomycetota bacterium]
MARKSEIRLGQVLVERQWCALARVNEGLASQVQLRSRGEGRPLGRILIEMGDIDEETLREALALLGALRLRCPVCREDHAVERYERGSVHACPHCKGPLVLADPLDASFRDAPAAPADSAGPAQERSRPPGPAGNPRAADASDTRPAAGATAPEAPRDPFIGKLLGGCEIQERIAHGGMGVVYRARQLTLGRTVAVKVLASDLARDESFVRRFLQEARSAAQLSHGNIVHINDVGECQGVFYFVMEHVDGCNLRDVLKTEERLDVARALDVALQLCHALRHAHGRGIIHRDIKPENIMVTREGVVKLADLGLAKRMAGESSAGITHAGSILGTPFYMAPEQAKDFSKVDHRSDIYSLGVTLYKMITGKVPFDGRSPIEVMIKALDGKKTRIRELRPEVPAEVEEIVERMMHRQPDKRYQQIDDVVADLSRVLVPAG